MPTRRLTETFARSAKADGRVYYWDDRIRGLGLRVAPSKRGTRGSLRKTWVFRYRTRAGALQREFKIGPYPAVDASTARAEASALVVEVLDGGDPNVARREVRDAMRVTELCDRFLEHHCATLSKTTQRTYRDKIKNHILHDSYGIGEIVVSQVERLHIQGLIDAIAEQVGRKGIRKVGQAKKVKGLVSSLFSYAVEIGAREPGPNPVQGVRIETRRRDWELAHVEPIGHVFEPDEARVVWRALDEVSIPEAAADALRLIALTGVRKEESRRLPWDWAKLSARHPHIELKRHKTDSKFPIKEVPLGRVALELLSSRRLSDAGNWVFPSPVDPAKPIGDLWAPWEKVRKHAGVPRARIHDLRGLAACYLKDSGWTEEMIATFMGWSSLEMVRRYVRCSRAVLKRGADIIELGVAPRGR